MPSPATARENGKKGGRPAGSKSWKTIEVEKAREFYMQEVARHLPELVATQIEAAKDPANTNERQYAVNQLIGKPRETIEVEADISLKIDL